MCYAMIFDARRNVILCALQWHVSFKHIHNKMSCFKAPVRSCTHKSVLPCISYTSLITCSVQFQCFALNTMIASHVHYCIYWVILIIHIEWVSWFKWPALHVIDILSIWCNWFNDALFAIMNQIQLIYACYEACYCNKLMCRYYQLIYLDRYYRMHIAKRCLILIVHIECDDWFTCALMNVLNDSNHSHWICKLVQMNYTTCDWYDIRSCNWFNDALFAIIKSTSNDYACYESMQWK